MLTRIFLSFHYWADFKSKSQNIWQQIILFSSTVMQIICGWHKIWALSGSLSIMRNVQLMKTNINIFVCTTSHTFLTMIIKESVCFMSCELNFFRNYSYVVHTNIFIFVFINWTLRMHDCLSFLHEVMIGIHQNKTTES
jgi:hypothetical protein